MVAKRAFHGGASRLVIGSHASEPVRATWNSTRATPLPGSLAVAASVIVPETLAARLSSEAVGAVRSITIAVAGADASFPTASAATARTS